MSDLTKSLLTQYYGIGSESNGKGFLSIHRSVENIKSKEEKHVIEQISSIANEENVLEDKFQGNNDEYQKKSITSDSRSHSEVFEDIARMYDLDENFENFNADFESNTLHDLSENTQSFIHDQSSNSVIELDENSGTEADENGNETDINLTFIKDVFPDNVSDISSTTGQHSEKSLKIVTEQSSMIKKEPICNQTFADFSATELTQFPNETLNKFPYLRMLYLSENNLIELPDDVFTCLKYLEWLDVRNNELSSLPATIKFHKSLETILLQRNNIQSLPLELGTLPKLKTLQVAENPLVNPPKDIVASGYSTILEFLRNEWNNAHPEERVEPKENKMKPKLSTILCYESPRKNKKKLVQLKSSIHDRNPSSREKRFSYKPSNRYPDENMFLTKGSFKSDSMFSDPCSPKSINWTIKKSLGYRGERTKCIILETLRRCRNEFDVPIEEEIDEINGKVLRLIGPSPRSLYVRRNIKMLTTYRRSTEKECRIMDKVDRFEYIKMENKNLSKEKRNIGVEKVERVFDIITKDGKRFELNPMRLNDSGWMLSCLENYVGIKKCKNEGTNTSVEHRLLLFSKLKELFAKQTSMLQKVKDENVLKQWRRSVSSYSKSMEKAMKRNQDDIPFGFDLEDYASIFKQNFKLGNRRSNIKEKRKFIPPKDINKKIDELLNSLNEIEMNDKEATTPRTKQNFYKNEIEKILQFQNEIKNLQRYNDIASISSKN